MNLINVYAKAHPGVDLFLLALSKMYSELKDRVMRTVEELRTKAITPPRRWGYPNNALASSASPLSDNQLVLSRE
jgi:hypothetical protein